MTRFRLTKAAKILIMVLVLALTGGGVFAGVKTGFIKTSTESEKTETIVDIKEEKNETLLATENVPTYDENGNVMNIEKTDDNTINLSLDEWIGWKSILDAEYYGIYDEL